jgi:hypothetical protein
MTPWRVSRGDQAAVRLWNSAPAAPSPTPAAAAATSAAAASAATPTAATATTATADPSHLLEPSDTVLLVEQMERGKTDVGHLFVAENEPLPGPGQVIVRLRDTCCGRRRCECVPRQRKSKSSGEASCTQRRRGSGFGRASPSCSLLHPCHGRFPRYISIQVDGTGMPVPRTNAKRRQRFLSARAFNVRCRFRLPRDNIQRDASHLDEHPSASEQR